MADGLIRNGSVRRVLLVTAETYTKFIHPEDRSLRTIFGDAATATLIDAADEPTLSGFRYGTDGTGADTLLVTKGGHRSAEQAHRPRHRQRWKSDLYMDGPALISFTVEAVPQLIKEVLAETGLTRDDIQYFLLHQATRKMMDFLSARLELDEQQMPLILENYGNTVSSTIPIMINHMRADGKLQPGVQSLLVGFGVGWSWAGCVWRESSTG
jgi:3-oxoacyl-[acyl-carrier-protein] synthase-3